MTKVAPRSTAKARAAKAAAFAKPYCWPWLSPKISSAIDAVAKTAPAMSSRAPTRRVWAGSTRRIAMTNTTMMGGLTRNTARQPMNSVQMPPRTTPALAPAAVAP